MSAFAFEYGSSRVRIRGDLAEAHRRAWAHVAAPGSWWTGKERVAIAAETRRALACRLCAERRAALSPYTVARGDGARGGAADSEPRSEPTRDFGRHDEAGVLPAPAVDLVHRVTTDASRLTRRWYEETLGPDLDPEHYVEALGVATLVISIDAFHHALGLPLEPLPEPQPGAPRRVRPSGAALEQAWVPMVRPDRLGPEDRDLYGGMARTGNVVRALSLVPDEVRAMTALSAAQYLSMRQMMRFDSPRAIDRAQMELVAGRVSALRECFY